MNSTTLYMTRGLPASGKSTWAKELVKNSRGACIRVNKDSLREMLDAGVWSKEREKGILKLRDHILWEALTSGKSVIIDDTNLNPIHDTHLRTLARSAGAEFVEVDEFLQVPVGECVRRDAGRTQGQVGEHVIRDMWRRYICQKPPAFNPKLPTVALCDLDGTLALLNGRSPYALEGHKNDLLNGKVADTLAALHRAGFISFPVFLSGRDERTHEETAEWIRTNTPWTAEHLYMRPSHDVRKDHIIKRELYRNHILSRFNVWGVFDDRDQVVDLWRELGLTCFQVADGAF